MAPEQPLQAWKLDVEDEDMANAIAASLDTPQVVAKYVQSAKWEPATEAQRRTHLRQNEALKEAAIDKDYPGLSIAFQNSLKDAKPKETAGKSRATSAVSEGLKCAQNASNPEPFTNQTSGAPKTDSVAITATCTESPNTPKSPNNIQDLIRDMDLELALRVPPVDDPNGDTYVYIDPPPKQPEQDDTSYHHYRRRFRFPMAMKSTTLLAANSPIFAEALGPTAQHRVMRRRRLVGQLPPQIKYVLDLTPAIEGEDAVHMLSEMYCSEGVRKWSIASNIWTISKTLIGGQDEYTVKHVNANKSDKVVYETIQSISNANEKAQRLLKYHEESMELSLEYSPIRHRSAIVRVLRTIAGHDPGLDSAAKVWTTCAVANFLEICSPMLLDYVVSWIYNGQNSYFLEVLPEASLKIADMLKCHNMCRDAFAILVGEEALESLCRYRLGNLPMTIHGRRKEDLIPESYRTRIEYASKAFVERVTSEFTYLVNMNWLEDITEFKKLSNTFPMSLTASNFEEYEKLLRSLRNAVKEYIRGGIYRLLCVDWVLDTSNLREWEYLRTNSLFPSKDTRVVWNMLMPDERILTRSFWHLLHVRALSYGPTNLSTSSVSIDFIPLSQPSDAEQELRADGVFKEVPIKQLQSLATAVQDMLAAPTASDGEGAYADTAHEDLAPPSDASLGKTISKAEDLLSPMDAMANLDMHSTVQNQDLIEPANATDYDAWDLNRVLNDAEAHLTGVAARILSHNDIDLHKVELLDVLGCLNDAEWKYLPLWAGGCDDGSGGVFNDDIPIASASFSHPGPHIHIGASSTAGSSEFGFINGPATHNTSTMTNNLSHTRASTDVASMFDAIVINSSAGSSARDLETHQALSEFGDSEYEFASATSVAEGPVRQNHRTAGISEEGRPMSAKAKGKQAVRYGENEELSREYLDRLEYERHVREVAEEAEFMNSLSEEEDDAAMEDGSKDDDEIASDIDDDNWLDNDSEINNTIGGPLDSDEDELLG